MIVIADTSPLNYLVRSRYVWLLPELFGQILMDFRVALEALKSLGFRVSSALEKSLLEMYDLEK